MTKGTVEWVWDCTSCGNKKVLGRHQDCPNCGNARPPGDIFYDPGNARVVTDPEELKRANAGPDWICAFCESSNLANTQNCQGCEASQDDSEKKRSVVFYPMGQEPSSSPINDQRKPTNSTSRRQRVPTVSRMRVNPNFVPMELAPRKAIAQQNKGPIIIGGLLLIIFFCSLFLIFKTHIEPVQVTSLPWERVVEIEEYKTVIEEDWSVPSGGIEKDSWRAVHHYDKVLDHYEKKSRQVSERYQSGTRQVQTGTSSNGNGYASPVYHTEPFYSTIHKTEYYDEPVYRNDPVYRTKYRYEIERWLYSRSVVARGVVGPTYWPDITLGEKERCGKRNEKYTVLFNSLPEAGGDVKNLEFSCDETEWQRFEIEGRYKARINGFDRITQIVWDQETN